MEQSKHTPGPWWVTDYGVRDAGGYICQTIKATRYEDQVERYVREREERAANARLIAAAPALLEALKEVTQLLDMLLGVSGGYPPDADGPAVKARAAIAAAEGTQ